MKKEVLLVSLLFLTACSTSTKLETNTAQKPESNKELKHHLYGKLEKINNSYEFTSYSTAYNENEPWVNLTTMQPMWDTKQEDCATGLVEITNKSLTCKTQDDTLFREKEVDLSPKKTAGYVLFSAMSLGVGAAFTPGAVKFNEDKFRSAITEAEKKLLTIDKITNFSYKTILDEYNLETKSFEDNFHKIVSEYKINSKPTFKLKDKSGLFGERSINYEKHISIKKNQTKNIKSIEPVSANSIDSLLFLTKNRNETLIKELRDQTSQLNIYCSNNRLTDVNYSVKCPNKIKTSQQNFNVEFTINSISFAKVLPRNMNFEDSKIKVIFDGYNFRIENKTESYITIESLSFYHNSKIASSSKLDYEVAPLAEAIFSNLRKLPINESAIEFKNMTRTKAQKKQLKYGIALKYKVVNTNQEKTLFQTKPYTLYTLI